MVTMDGNNNYASVCIMMSTITLKIISERNNIDYFIEPSLP